MARRNEGNPEIQDCHTFDLATELTERMEMTRKEATSFIHNVMTRAGFRTEQGRDSYVQGGEDDERGGRRGRRGGRNDDGGFMD